MVSEAFKEHILTAPVLYDTLIRDLHAADSYSLPQQDVNHSYNANLHHGTAIVATIHCHTTQYFGG